MNIGTPLLAFSNEKPHWGKSAAIKCNYIATCTVAPILVDTHPNALLLSKSCTNMEDSLKKIRRRRCRRRRAQKNQEGRGGEVRWDG